jgi:hypothetical protein
MRRRPQDKTQLGHLVATSHGDIQIWDKPHSEAYRSWFSKVKRGMDPLGNFVGSLRQKDVALVVEEWVDKDAAGIRIVTSSGKTGWVNGAYVVRIG